MIISASRRTDIPAFFSEWFMGRIREGYCRVPNPYNPAQVSHISLDPADVEVIVFVTRNAAPLLTYLDELDARGYRYYFHYTLTGYPRELERHTPDQAAAIDTIRRLTDHVGPDRVIWRYDPILFTSLTPLEYHLRQFTELAEQLDGLTRRVIVSIVDDYRHVCASLQRLAKSGVSTLSCPPDSPEFQQLMRALADCAHAHHLEITSCAEEIDLRPYGIMPGKCIDDAYIKSVFGIDVIHAKDPSQRKACGCVKSRDIGAYDTCSHACAYCYATRSEERVRQNLACHDMNAPTLL
ncbi:MAG: DUF1848 domain-containing protein [Armatimonadota bacterium]